jgi:hypothetical protein
MPWRRYKMKNDDRAFQVLDSHDASGGDVRLDHIDVNTSLQKYASVHLKVPMSGDTELDAMIRESRRLDIAQEMLPQLYAHTWDETNSAERSLAFADALLAEWEKRVKGVKDD